MALEELFAVVLGKEIGNTIQDCHGLLVVLLVDIAVPDKSLCTGGITIIPPLVPGMQPIAIIPGHLLLMIMAPRSLMSHPGGTSLGIFLIPFVFHSFLGAAHFFIFNVGVGYATAFFISLYHFPSCTRVSAVSS